MKCPAAGTALGAVAPWLREREDMGRFGGAAAFRIAGIRRMGRGTDLMGIA